MDVNQIYDIVNVAAELSLGQKAITVVDTTSFVSLGDQLENLSKKDMFNNVLNDVIGRTVVSQREFIFNNVDGMVLKGFEYGAILRKLYVDVPDAIENPAYEIGKADFEAKYAPIYKPTIKQYMYSKTGTFEMGVSIPDDLYDSAFNSETDLAILISAIHTALNNRYNIALDNLKRLCRATYMGNVISSGGVRAVDILQPYNTATGKTLTQDQALRDPDYLSWAAMTIEQYTKRLADPSTMYNAAGNLHQTPRDLQVLTLLENFTTAVKFNLRSNIYHEELVSLPRYNEVNFWQGTGTSYAFKDASTIAVKVPTTGTDGVVTTKDFTQSYVIGILYDIEAMGVCIDKIRDKVQYYPHEEFTNYWKKATKGFFNDLSENAVVFYMGSPATNTVNVVTGTTAQKTARKVK